MKRPAAGARLLIAAVVLAAEPVTGWAAAARLRPSVRSSLPAPAWRSAFVHELRSILRDVALPMRPEYRATQASGAIVYLAERFGQAGSDAERQARWTAADLLARPSARWELRRALQRHSYDVSPAVADDLSAALDRVEDAMSSLSPAERRRFIEGLAAVKKEAFGAGINKERAAEAIRSAFSAGRALELTGEDVDPSALERPNGAAPQGADLLKRAAEGVSGWKLARAVKTSKDYPEVLSKLERLGVAFPGEHRLADQDDLARFEFAVRQLWWETSPALAPKWTPKAGELPSLAVERDGIRFFIHGTAHGWRWGELSLQSPPAAVKRLISRIEKANGALYSEQWLPLLFGYSHGLEFRDERSFLTGRAPLRPARSMGPGLLTALGTTRAAVIAAGLALAAAAAAAPAYAWIAAPFAAILIGFAAISASSLVILRANILMDSWSARRKGLSDPAAYLARIYRFTARTIDAGAYMNRHLLPLPLGAAGGISEDDRIIALRSKAMARSALMDAKSRGLKEAHLLVGQAHVPQIASYLSDPEVPAGAGPKDLSSKAPTAHRGNNGGGYNDGPL